ncbi:MAG: 16S rRNA (guanine(966)-N(2))-methyltransferase RsmD [Deltaproteobacteria bacterium]|nr:16S rRNA (guanine(966)-N(2))-methyltransferase RsmD [Deltaproteobacteria bacterium]
MRITGGQIRGRRLHTPRGLLVRPTSDRVREAVFNILGQRLPGLNVLDIFSGTGSLGIEALSRGAVSAIFIDRLRQAIDLIRKNIDSCGYGDRGTILRWDLTKGVPWGHPLLRKRRLDLVFVDPPYSRNLAIPALTGISQGKGLNAGARVVVESAKGSDLPPAFSSLQKVDARIYGDTEITIYEFRD